MKAPRSGIAALLSAAALGLAGCGDDDDNGDVPGTDNTTFTDTFTDETTTDDTTDENTTDEDTTEEETTTEETD